MKYIFILLTASLFIQPPLSAQCWRQVATAGATHVVALKNDGTLWAWGLNYHGELGNGTNGINTGQTAPVQIGTANDWRWVATGYYHSLAIRNDGTLWAWGNNIGGQLGIGTFTDKNMPTQVGTDHDWQQVVAGDSHTLAIKSDGSLWVWGISLHGELGVPGLIHESPTALDTAHNWQQVSAGYRHSVAIKTDGSLWAWGWNDHGQLGDGGSIQAYAPKQVGTDYDWKQVSGGHHHTVAIKTDGTLWGWGENSAGEVGNGGDGGNPDRLLPAQIGNASDWRQVTAEGSDTNLAIKNDTTLWGWGENNYGQLEHPALINIYHPVQIGNTHDWKQVACGSQYTEVLKTDGTLWAAGNNGFGALGDGTYMTTSTPVEIACVTTAVENPSLTGSHLQLSPNPAQDLLTIRATALRPEYLAFEIRNMLGEVIYPRQPLPNSREIDVEQLTPGIYMVIVSNGAGHITRQFVKIGK